MRWTVQSTENAVEGIETASFKEQCSSDKLAETQQVDMDEVHRVDKPDILTQSDCSNLYMSESQDMAMSSHKFDRADTLILQEVVKTVFLYNQRKITRTEADNPSTI